MHPLRIQKKEDLLCVRKLKNMETKEKRKEGSKEDKKGKKDGKYKASIEIAKKIIASGNNGI